MSRRFQSALAVLGLAVGLVATTTATTSDTSLADATASVGDPAVSSGRPLAEGKDKVRCALPEGQRADSSTLHRIDSGGIERQFILRLPEGYESQKSWPLIVAYHGRGSTGPEVEGYSELSTLPAIVAYPYGDFGTGDGHRRAWQGAPYEAPGVDDVAFTEDLLDHVEANYCVDPRRVYATGKSNGGGMAALLACQLPDRFAAIAPVASAFYPGTAEDCQENGQVPVMVVHGTGDSTIPYAGDPGRNLPAIEDWVHDKVEANDCSSHPRLRTIGNDFTITTWRGCDRGSQVALVAVDNGGHVWPGATVYSGGGYQTRDAKTHDLVWEFFTRHRLTGPFSADNSDVGSDASETDHRSDAEQGSD